MIQINKFETEISGITEQLMSGKDLKDHGFEHVLSVVQYGKDIMRHSDISETCDILAALYLHDIARVDDSVDNTHGSKGALMFKELIYPKYPFLDNKSIMFAIANHQNYDKFLISHYSNLKQINLNVPIILWDADRLDLPRIQKFFGKVNPEYLHTLYAKKFANSIEHLTIYKSMNNNQ
jgi:hypothetical protein